jgi:FeS assembly SUF system protein
MGFLRRMFGGGSEPQAAEVSAPVQEAAPVSDTSAPPVQDPPREEAAGGDADTSEMKEQVVDALRTVYDPEIPVNIYELGLVYGINIDRKSHVVVRMTLTSPGCPVAGSLPPEVENKVLAIPGVTSARVELVWDPPWSPELMSEAAKLQLGMF